MSEKPGPESVVREIRRKIRRRTTAEEKIRMVLEGLKGEESIAELCRRERISPNRYFTWSKEFLEVGKRQLRISHRTAIFAAPSARARNTSHFN